MANKSISREIKIALFAIVILLTLYFVVNYLKGETLFSNRNGYTALYHEVNGLAPTAPIYIRGLKVGTIEAIDYEQERDLFSVKLKIKSQYKIPSNSTAEVYSSDIMGSRAIRINIGDSPLLLKSRDTISTSVELGLLEMLTGELIPLKEEISSLLTTVQEVFQQASQILGEENRVSLTNSLHSLSQNLSNIEKFSHQLGESSPKIATIIEQLNQLSLKLESGASTLNRGLEEVVQFGESLNSANIAETIISLRELLEAIKDPSGTTGKLIETDTLHNSIEELLKEIELLVNAIKENPKKYLKISVF